MSKPGLFYSPFKELELSAVWRTTREGHRISDQDVKIKFTHYVQEISHSCRKLIFFIYILIYLLSGLVLLAIGILVEVERRELSALEKWLALPTAILIFIGLVVSINGLCGCVGTLEENIVLLKLFFGVSVITFICQICLAVLVFCYGERATSVKATEFADDIFSKRNYDTNFDLQQAVHTLQIKYSCCGMSSYLDYNNYLAVCKQRCFYADATALQHNCQYICVYPETCCRISVAPGVSHSCTFKQPSEAANFLRTKSGCYNKFLGWMIERLNLIGGTAFGLALPQVVGLVWTFLFLRKIKEYHSWFTVDLTNENDAL